MGALPAEQRERYLQASTIAKAPAQQAALFMNCLSPAKAKPFSETETGRGNRLAVSKTFLLRKALSISLWLFAVTHGVLGAQSPPGKSGTASASLFALVRIPSRLIAKKRIKKEIVIGEQADHSCRKRRSFERSC
ncbi:hypothetical protein ACLK1T_04270 [Escherichia coli]